MPHNPENVPNSELFPNYRFLDKDEYVEYDRPNLIDFCIKEGERFDWLRASSGHAVGESHRWTYRTQLSREELARYRKVPIEKCTGHNPEKVSLKTLEPEKGYRFLDEDEYVVYQSNPPIQYFENVRFTNNCAPHACWESFSNGRHVVASNKIWTYRTCYSREGLAAYRADRPPVVKAETPRTVMTRVHFAAIAKQIKRARKHERAKLVDLFVPALKATNPRFNETTFRKAAGV